MTIDPDNDTTPMPKQAASKQWPHIVLEPTYKPSTNPYDRPVAALQRSFKPASDVFHSQKEQPTTSVHFQHAMNPPTFATPHAPASVPQTVTVTTPTPKTELPPLNRDATLK